MRQAQERVQALVPGTTVREHHLEGLDTLDAPVVETTILAGGRAAQRAGALLVVKPMLVAAPVMAAALPSGARTSRLWLGLPRENLVVVVVHAPAGWAPEALPRPFHHANQWFTMEGAWESQESGFRHEAQARLLVTEVPASEYEAFRTALLAAASAESEGVVLVRAPE